MSNISAQTLARTIVLAAALINQALTAIGRNPFPFSDDELYSALTSIFSVAATAWAWWKNNSITGAAKAADSVKDAIRDGAITTVDVENLLNTSED